MQILIFEWLCGGGLLLEGIQPHQVDSLVRQGQDMLSAVCADFVAAGADLIVPVDPRLGLDLPGKHCEVAEPRALRELLIRLAGDAEAVLVIAPESEGHLGNCLGWLQQFSAKLLNPNLQFTGLCSDKNQLQEYLADHNVDVPAGYRAGSNKNLTSPAGYVIKPYDGCGGECVRFVEALNPEIESTINTDDRIEEFVPGLAVSVAAISGPQGVRIFPPLRQKFDAHPVGHFVNCVDDLSPGISARATQLAKKVIEVLPQTSGYFGIDMVIGDRDVVIEINPRITMSYPVLREKLDINLAELMVAFATGKANNAGITYPLRS